MSSEFSFSAAMPPMNRGVDEWRRALTTIEAAGYATVAISDHTIGGWALDPLATLAAAAVVTRTLRLRTLVLANDYRHPVLVQRAASTIEALSEGRLELGLGAGWWREEYDALGLEYDPPRRRIDRLEASIRLIKQLFEPGVVTSEGPDYRIREVPGVPPPGGRPRPPIFVGGGGRAILSVAGREADIAGINPRLGRGAPRTAADIGYLTPDVLRELVAAVESAARAAARPSPRIQISLLAYDVELSDGRRARWQSSIAPSEWSTAARLPSVPGVLTGSVDACTEQLEEWREQFGIVDVHIGGPPRALADVVSRVAGR